LNKQTIAIAGLGEVGFNVLKELLQKNDIFNIIGIDKDEHKFDRQLPVQYSTNLDISADIFIIDVYSSEEVIDIINSIDYSNRPLIMIESTINPKICAKIEKKVANKVYLAYFPHRYNKGDEDHQVFNQKRVLGAFNKESEKRALKFLSNFMKSDDIIVTSPEIAILSKLVENSHRFVEIALAEEIALYCKRNDINFGELRRCVNSKWNIDMKEARQGIYSKCLPKDIKIFDAIFKKNLLLKAAMKVDDKYKLKSNKPEEDYAS